MSPTGAPVRKPPLHARWLVVVATAMIVAGLALWRVPAANEVAFRAVNDLGPLAPTAWSSLTVAGLALSAWIYLSAFAQRRPERVARLLWIIVVGGVVVHLVKHALASPRPLAALGAAHLNVIGEALRTQSMPSGHSAMAFAVLGLMLMERPGRSPGDRGPDSTARTVLPAWLVPLGWLVLAAGIALSRLAVGAHWPADALFGGGLGLLFAGFAPRAWPVRALTSLLSRPLGARLMAVGLFVSALAIAATPGVMAMAGLAGSTLEKKLATGYPLAEALQWVLALVALIGTARWWRASTSGVMTASMAASSRGVA